MVKFASLSALKKLPSNCKSCYVAFSLCNKLTVTPFSSVAYQCVTCKLDQALRVIAKVSTLLGILQSMSQKPVQRKDAGGRSTT